MSDLKSFSETIANKNLHAKPLAGDWLVIAASLITIVFLFQTLWQGGQASRLIIRQGDHIYATLSLDQKRSLEIPGPLGISRVEIDHGRARVASDPGKHQYCVKQGWINQAGQVAMCLPNQVSIELLGARKQYDSLNY